MPNYPWAFWRWVGLRGAGFPAETVLRLASPGIARAADAFLETEAKSRQARQKSLTTFLQDIDQAEPEQRAVLQKALRRMQKGKVPGPILIECATQNTIEEYRAARTRLDTARVAFYQTFDDQVIEIRKTIREFANMDEFREAILWQNQQAIHGSIAALLRTKVEDVNEKKQRKYEQLVANYLQRYCVKNDTIGFFGPVGWLQLEPEGEIISVRAGANLLAKRTVYFEGWCIDTLAEVLGQNKALKPWMIPRPIHTTYLEGTKCYLSYGRPIQLLPVQAAVLQACDGVRTAREIALSLLKSPGSKFRNEKEIYNILEFLRTCGAILWSLEVPFELRPERSLRHILEHIEEDRLRQPAIAALEELECARQSVANAAGNAQQLDEALLHLNDVFTHLTGSAPTRMAGQVYAGRTLVFEDCQRDLEVKLGPDVLNVLESSLALLLTSARWFTFQTARRYREIFTQLYTEISEKISSSTVSMVQFWPRARLLLFGETEFSPINELISLFQERWATILPLDQGQHHVAYTSEELWPQVQEIFNAPSAGWRFARFHSPDILIAASSVDAIQRGEYQCILGELHTARNTLASEVFVSQHPYPEDLHHALELSIPEERIVPLIPKKWTRVTSRVLPALVSPNDFRLIFTQDAIGALPSQALPLGSLIIKDTPEGLCVCTRDGKVELDIIEVFSEALSLLVVSSFGLFRPVGHTPRVTIDRLVVCRETWRYPVSELPFVETASEAERFLSVRRWARAQELPRFVFVKVPGELKPFYIDFDSPIYVDILAKAVRRVRGYGAEAQITLSEMLPGYEDLWLPDAKGQHFTSELRLVAVDLLR